ncbi:MAG: hypothetical protein ABIC57_00215 [bacterium]
MKKIKRLIAVGSLVFLSIFPFLNQVNAKVGVGVTTGVIQIDERLMSGLIYNLPAFNVVNTGDEASDYEVSTAYRENQEERRPSVEWFNFEPSAFHLEPGETQTVDIEIRLPLETIPGDYFCFVEGHPVLSEGGGVTQIGISAASKLYFTIAPSNFLEGIYYRLLSLWVKYQPWTTVGGAVVLAFIIVMILRKFIKIDVKLNKPIKRAKDNDKISEK